jgi:hypothetical protein
MVQLMVGHVMDRRTFLAGTGAVLLAAPLDVEAQQPGKVYRIGILGICFISQISLSRVEL